MAALRGGPILDQQYLFNPEMLRDIQAERDASRSEALQTAALTRLAYPAQQNRQTVKKRAPSAAASVPPPPPKKAKTHQQGSKAGKTSSHGTPMTPQSSSRGA